MLYTNAFASRKRSLMKILQSLKQERKGYSTLGNESLRSAFFVCTEFIPWLSKLYAFAEWAPPLEENLCEPVFTDLASHPTYISFPNENMNSKLWSNTLVCISIFIRGRPAKLPDIVTSQWKCVCQEERSWRCNYEQFIKIKPQGWKWTAIIWNYKSGCI
jgi:hypothetical protein